MNKPVIVGRKIRIAIVGLGRISKNHIASIEQFKDDLELVGVCDTDSSVLEEAAAVTGAKAYSSLTAMLSESGADIYSLCTPSGLHSPQAIEIAEAGKNIISEKPMATTWNDGLKMVEASKRNNVWLFVVKQNRLNPTLHLVKKAIDENRFGQIYMVTINVFWSRPQEYYDQASWRGTWSMDGGTLMNQASHYVDLIDWLIGPVQSLQAYTATLARKIEAEDTAVLAIKWKSGAIGSLNATVLTYDKNFEGSLTILGENGTVRLGGIAVNEIQHWKFAEPSADDARVGEANYETSSVYGFGHRAYYANVIRTLRGEATSVIDGLQGLRSLEILSAAYKAAVEQRMVTLPLESGI